MTSRIVIIDQSKHSGYDDTALAALKTALQTQITKNAAPAWHRRTMTVVTTRTATVADHDDWPIYLLDSPDVANALGYHDVDPQGRPYGRVFVDPTRSAGVSLSSVISHEVLEAFGDSDVNFWGDSGRGVAVALELCDPVENSVYQIDGVKLSNFVLPAWFNPYVPAGTKVDFLAHLHHPYQLESGGYKITMVEGRIGQVFADGYPEWKKALKRTEQPSRTVWREVHEFADQGDN